MECPLNKFCEKNKQYAPLILRLVVGIAFAAHGWQKFQNVAGVAGFFGGMGIPFAGVMAWVVTLVELVGGIALILGVAVRHVALLQAITMAVAILKVHLKNGLLGQGGYELSLLFFAATVSLVLSGAGPLSVDSLCGKLCNKKKEAATALKTEVSASKTKKSKK